MSASQPTLLVVMGTSGSGKSTVGVALAHALVCPFVDGDDLHPASNVEKMSHGHALDDDDREPWLHRIRETALQLTTAPSPHHQERVKEQNVGGGDEVRKLAEVYETSQQDPAPAPPQNGAKPASADSAPHSVDHRTAVIACSALKLAYRQLLRGSITALAQQCAAPEQVPTDLKVIHLYLNLSRNLLEQRMADRKGHFMKLDMLYSQLDTLQPPHPDAEPNVIVVDVQPQSSTQDIVQSITKQLTRL